tara:strand:- start:1711 stop:1935 length:225 start_codon:yes stop_codon:yes gene_type:complete
MMSDIDPKSELMIALDDAWAAHWAHNYSATPNRKLFYKFAAYIKYENDDQDILNEINSVVPDQFPSFLDYLIGT